MAVSGPSIASNMATLMSSLRRTRSISSWVQIAKALLMRYRPCCRPWLASYFVRFGPGCQAVLRQGLRGRGEPRLIWKAATVVLGASKTAVQENGQS